ncbi:hypothetical protein KAX35_02165 [candidate division WOR-3 bacterium]|nr:hypothetical protein [candidate division WOR-3 bacterium]
MGKEVIEKALTKEVAKKIEEGNAYNLESEVEESVKNKLKKAGSFEKVANKVINQVKKVEKKEMEMPKAESPRKKRSPKKSTGNYLRNW